MLAYFGGHATGYGQFRPAFRHMENAKMKILILLIALSVTSPAFGAQADAAKAKAETQTETMTDKPAADKQEKEGKDEKKEGIPGEYACKYYKVKLPDDWKAIMPPTDKQGTVSAIFAANTGAPVVTIIIGPSGGADAKTIAGMFAEQFKAPNPPAEKNGTFTFSFPMQNATAKAYIATQDKDFMVTTISGNVRQAKAFIKNSITSDNWGSLLPQ